MSPVGRHFSNLQESSPRPLRQDLATWLNGQIAVLYPGCFALVMATGIISNALFINGHRQLSEALFAINLFVLVWPISKM